MDDMSGHSSFRISNPSSNLAPFFVGHRDCQILHCARTVGRDGLPYA